MGNWVLFSVSHFWAASLGVPGDALYSRRFLDRMTIERSKVSCGVIGISRE